MNNGKRKCRKASEQKFRTLSELVATKSLTWFTLSNLQRDGSYLETPPSDFLFLPLFYIRLYCMSPNKERWGKRLKNANIMIGLHFPKIHILNRT